MELVDVYNVFFFVFFYSQYILPDTFSWKLGVIFKLFYFHLHLFPLFYFFPYFLFLPKISSPQGHRGGGVDYL